ncbi:MAG: hypothetical protein MK135_05955 [Polyangiaceae bacterium]|nr:hypothetical protein [Polyangiaceae bacterium]
MTLVPKTASATGTPEVKTGAKGVIGGLLVGAELVVGVEALIGLDQWWAYAAGAGAGAVAGGIGGYYIGKASTPAATGMLISGIILSIPATVFTLQAISYKVPSDATTTAFHLPEGERTLMDQSQFQALQIQRPVGAALLNHDSEKLNIKMPTISIDQVYSIEEQSIHGVASLTDYQMSLLSLQF